MPGHVQPLSLQPNGTSGDTQHYRATLRKCLLSSRSRVRVAVGAQIVQVGVDIRNYDCSNDLLLAGDHSYLMYRLAGRCGGHPAVALTSMALCDGSGMAQMCSTRTRTSSMTVVWPAVSEISFACGSRL